MKPLFLIDAYGLIYRAYFALIRAPMRTKDGRNTSAIYGFFRMLFRFVKEYDPVYCGVVLDSLTPTFREKTFEAYKATRQKTPEDLHPQIPVIEEILEALGFATVRMNGFEADDVMGTLAAMAQAEGRPCFVVSGDKDLAQLVTKGVRIVRMDKDDFVVLDEEGVKEKWGVRADQIVDFLALVGDASDNIPGVEGIGEKTAQRLLAEYGSLEGVYAHLDELSPSLRRKLEEGRERAFLSRDLATIRTDLELSLTIEDLRRREPDVQRARELFLAYDIRSLAQEVGGSPSVGEKPTLEVEGPSRAGVSYEVVTDRASLARWVDEALERGAVAVDTETDGLDPLTCRLVGLSLAVDEGRACYVPLAAPDVRPLPADVVREVLSPLLVSTEVVKVGQNLKFDYHVLRRWGVRPGGPFFDTMVAAWLLESDAGRYNLDRLAEKYLGWRTIHYKDVVEKGASFETVPVAEAGVYAAEDADIALRLSRVLKERLEAEGLGRVFYEMEMPLLSILARMEEWGIGLDGEALSAFGRELKERISTIEKEIFELVGHEFNVGSTKQLQEVLFVERGLPPVKKTKTGFSTDTSVLEELAARDPVAAKVLEYRSLTKLKNTYVDVLPGLVNPGTGRLHTWFSQVGTATGRLSSKDPNLQNIPIKTEEGRRIRGAFVPQRGWWFLSADYSQIELVILAHLSEDPALCRAFREGEDVHRATGSLLFGVPPEAVTPEQRRIAKTINFGVIYGMSAFRLSRELGIPRKEAERFIDAYFTTYAGVRAFIERTIAEAEEKGYVTTLFGRKRPLPYITSRNKTQKTGAERIAVNTPIQGSGADIIKLAMIDLDAQMRRMGLASRMILQVHDELIFEVPPEELEMMKRLVRERMEGVVRLSVPLRVEIGVGRNWGEAH